MLGDTLLAPMLASAKELVVEPASAEILASLSLPARGPEGTLPVIAYVPGNGVTITSSRWWARRVCEAYGNKLRSGLTELRPMVGEWLISVRRGTSDRAFHAIRRSALAGLRRASAGAPSFAEPCSRSLSRESPSA